jgi:hypothetical protein
MSNRYITDQQFSDGTTIDGSRLEKALQQLEEWTNQVPNGHMKNRWTQSQMVFRYFPPCSSSDAELATNTGIAGNIRHYPWLPVFNPSDSSNPMRVKGTKVPWVSAYANPNPASEYANSQAVWQVSFATADTPLLIEGIDALFLCDDPAASSHEFVNTWLWTSSPPSGATPSTYIEDVQITLTADNSFIPELQSGNSVLFTRRNFSVLNSIMSPSGPPAAFADMAPALDSNLGGNAPSFSLSFNEHGLFLPIPSYTRLKLSIVVPTYSQDPWASLPWKTFNPTLTLTILEGLEDG